MKEFPRLDCLAAVIVKSKGKGFARFVSYKTIAQSIIANIGVKCRLFATFNGRF